METSTLVAAAAQDQSGGSARSWATTSSRWSVAPAAMPRSIAFWSSDGSGHDALDLVVVVARGRRMGPHEPEESQRAFGITVGESPVRLDEHAEEQ